MNYPNDKPPQRRGSRLRRDSMAVARGIETFVATHKFIASAVALLALGFAFAIYMNQYATLSDISKRHKDDELIRTEIQSLKERDAEFKSALEAIQKSSTETRDDIKTLLQHVLSNPPKRDQK